MGAGSRVRTALAGALVTPAISLVAARLAVLVAASVRGLPTGLHTYLPASNLVPVPWLMAASVGAFLVAGATWRPARVRPLLAVGLLLAGQALYHVLQLAILDRLQGVPDAAGPVVLGLAVPAFLLLTIAAVLGGAGRLLFQPPSISLRPPRFGTPVPVLAPRLLQLVPVRLDGAPVRRGPPPRFSR